jgi:hypothetical protein
MLGFDEKAEITDMVFVSVAGHCIEKERAARR